MDTAIRQFIDAHQRYEALEKIRTECSSPEEREQMHISLLRAYLEVQHRARIIAGLQFADGVRFAEMN